jgi:hypothetical protein
MIKCAKCGTGWTSSGLPLCPVCGARIDDSAGRVPAAKVAEKSTSPSSPPSALLEAPAVPLKVHQALPAAKVVEKSTAAVAAASAIFEAPAEPLKIQKVLPAPPGPRVEPALPTVVRRESAPKTEVRPELSKSRADDFERLELSDPSALSLPVVRPLGTTSRPLNGPLVLGALAYVGVFLFPLSIAFESSRVLGVLGFCMTAFFAPFAPIAWMAGLSVEKRRRDQGLRPENPVALGRLLGQWATMLLVSEVTLALIGIAALRLAGRFPFSFWAPIY